MTQKLAASVLFAMALAGCSMLQPEEKLPPPPQASSVELTKEQGGRFIAFVGPRLQHTEPFLAVDGTNFYVLRSWLDNKTGEVAHQLYVEDSYYGGPYLWDGVHDAEGKKLQFIPISRNQISCDEGCSYADEFAASLSDDYLRAHHDGLAVTFTASDGKTLALTVPSNLVTEELTAVDAVRGIAEKAAATPAATNSPTPNGR